MESTHGVCKVNKIGRITLREAQRSEAPAILRILHAAFAEYEGVLDPPSGAHDETVDTVTQWLTRGSAVIAEVDEQPVGFAFYERRDGERVYFGRLSVLPEFRSQGIAQQLLEYVEQHARDRGAASVTLGVRLQLPHLVARYERLGYRITKYMTHPGYKEPTYLFMAKDLRS